MLSLSTYRQTNEINKCLSQFWEKTRYSYQNDQQKKAHHLVQLTSLIVHKRVFNTQKNKIVLSNELNLK